MANTDSLKFDLGSSVDQQRWNIVNDGVMGGLSSGEVAYQDHSITFFGQISLENNGGFSWMKSSLTNMDLSSYTTVRLRVKGEGRSYYFTLEDNRNYSALYFKESFTTEKDQWTTIELPLEKFEQTYFGRNTGRNLDERSDIRRMGFLQNDKNAGYFKLEVDFVEFF